MRAYARSPLPRPHPPFLMDKSEFERIKAEEKAHLQKLRQLKQTHRQAKRTASTLGALNSMRDANLEAETDAMTDKLMTDAARAEARFDLALEGHAPVTGNADALDREALAKAEAEALVRQMKIEMGGASEVSATEAAQAAASPSAPASAKTIGRTPPPADEPPAADRGDKSIGRSRGQ